MKNPVLRNLTARNYLKKEDIFLMGGGYSDRKRAEAAVNG